MTIRLNSRIQSTLLISSMLMISACASFKTGGSKVHKTDEASSITLKEGEFQTPPVLQQTSTAVLNEPVKIVAEAPEVTQPFKPNKSRINSREPLVNARTAPMARSRVVAVLKQGQKVEVLGKRTGWLKIKWQQGDTVKHGWVNKSFVEECE